MTRTYVPSGKFSPLIFLLTPLFVLPVAAVGGALYSYIILYLPLIGYVTFLLTFGLSVVVSVPMTKALDKLHTRNRLVALAAGVFTGLMTLWLTWVVYTFAVVQQSDGDAPLWAFLLPNVLSAAISAINEHGVWSLHGATPTGAVLWLLWFIEAAIIVGVPVSSALTAASKPYCEDCLQWGAEDRGVRFLAAMDKATAREALGASVISTALNTPIADAKHVTRIDAHVCTCGSLTTLSAVEVTVTVDSKGKIETKENLLVEHVLTTRGLLVALKVPMVAATVETPEGQAEPVVTQSTTAPLTS